MKYKILFLFTLPTFIGHSQTYLGIGGGVSNMTYVRDKNHSTWLDLTGAPTPSFDIQFRERKNNLINLTGDLTYLKRHFEGSAGSRSQATLGQISASGVTHSLSLHLLPEAHFGKRIDLFLSFGIGLGYRFSTRHQASGYSTIWIQPDTIKTTSWQNEAVQKNKLRRPEVSLKSMAGFHIPINENLSMTLSSSFSIYVSGLSNDDYNLFPNLKTHVWSVHVGINCYLPEFALSKYIVPKPIPID